MMWQSNQHKALFSEPCSGAVGGESAAAASCVGQGWPMGVGFRPVLATAASEAALAKACAALFVPDFCLTRPSAEA